MRRILTAFIFVALPLASALAVARPGLAQPKPAETSTVDLAALDRTTDPCVDFYQFACGGWMASHPIPADRSIWARFDELQERNDDDASSDFSSRPRPQPTAETRKIGDYYGSCMDEAGIDAKGVMPLQSELDRIASLANRDGLPSVLAMLHPIGTPAFFGVGSAPDIDNADLNMAIVGAGGLGLPDRDYYFRDDATVDGAAARNTSQHVVEDAPALGIAAPIRDVGSTTVMRVETALAKPQLDVVARRDPANVNHKMSLR